MATRARAERELAAVDEIRRVLESEDGFVIETLPDLGAVIERLAVPGSMLEGALIASFGALLATSRRASSDLDGRVASDGLVAEWVDRLWSDRALEDRIGRCFDADGEISDDASPELRSLRRRLQDRRARLVDQLERYTRSLPERIRVPDGSVTVRGGRYCVPVRREGKKTVGGLVHDASASRQTLFVEPAIAIDGMNEIRELEIAVRREIDRILRELTDRLHENLPELSATYGALCDLDVARARAMFAHKLGCTPVELVEPSEPVRIREGRHPILADRGSVVPFDLDLDLDERGALDLGTQRRWGKRFCSRAWDSCRRWRGAASCPPWGKTRVCRS